MSSTGWAPFTVEQQRIADELDRLTGLDVDGGRDLGVDEESYEGLTLAERELARRLDVMTKAVVEDEDAADRRHRRDYTNLGDGLTVNTAMVLDQLTGVRP